MSGIVDTIAKPMWNDDTGGFMYYSAGDLELKAFILFYINVLWPDEDRNAFNSLRPGKVNCGVESKFYPWNQGILSEYNIKKWFPRAIFPEGPGYDSESCLLSRRLRGCLDLLVKCFFKKPKLMIKKCPLSGLGWYDDDNNELDLDMHEDITLQTTDFIILYL